MAKIAMTSDKKIMVLNEGVEGIPSITIDSELSDTSTNPVQNKVIKAAIDAVDTKAGNKIASSEKGAANGVATLGADALLSAAQRPKAGGLYRDDGTTTVEASLAEISTTLQNKADLGADGKVPESQLPDMDYAPSSHTQGAGTITAGTFAGQVIANSSGQDCSISLLRNSKLVSAETNPTVNGEICWTYE